MIRAVYVLPIGPFLQWLRSIRPQYETVDELADYIQQRPPWVRDIFLGKIKTIDIDKADEILCLYGSVHLRDIYPDIYEEIDPMP